MQALHDLREENKKKSKNLPPSPPSEETHEDDIVIDDGDVALVDSKEKQEEQDILNEGEDPAERSFMPLRLLKKMQVLVFMLVGPMSNASLSAEEKNKVILRRGA